MNMVAAIKPFFRPPDMRSEAQIESELDEEFQFHLEQIERELLETDPRLPVREAARLAQERFGSTRRLRKQCKRIAMEERTMLQRINLVLMVVVLLAVIGATVPMYLTQRDTALTLQAIAAQLAAMETSAAPGAVSEQRLPEGGVAHGESNATSGQLASAPGMAIGDGTASEWSEERADFERIKQQVSDEITEVLQTMAFSLSGDLAKWPDVEPELRQAIADAPDEASFVGAVNAALRSLGVSHLSLRSPRQAAVAESSHVLNIGIKSVPVPDGLLVTRVLPDGPAAEAGLKAGDVVLSVEGQPATSAGQFSRNDGQELSLEVRDEAGDARLVDVAVGSVARIWPIEVFRIDDDTVVIVCDSFEDYAPTEVTELLASVADAGNIIIDLRDNPGGFGLYALHFVSHFIPPHTRLGVHVSREGLSHFVQETGRQQSDLAAFAAWSPSAFTSVDTGRELLRGRIAVLVNQGTTSAAEISARGLRDLAGAQIIGAPTGGKVQAGSRRRLSGGFQLFYPSTDYVTVEGERLEGRGVAPDHKWTAPRRIAGEAPDPGWVFARDRLHDAAAEAVLRAAVERARTVEAVAGEVEIRRSATADSAATMELRASVKMKRLRDGDAGWAVAYEARIQASQPNVSGEYGVIYDGQRLLVADRLARRAFILDRDEGAGEFLRDRRALHTRASRGEYFSGLVFESAFSREVRKSLRHAGTREFDGVECDVIEFEGGAEGVKVTKTWFIGREDGVIRRANEVVRIGENQFETEERFTGVRVNPGAGELGDDAFLVMMPEGFEQVPYER